MLGEAGTPRPGTPSSVHSGELPATRVRRCLFQSLILVIYIILYSNLGALGMLLARI